MTVAAILNEKGRDVITALPEQTLSEICDVLTEKGIGAIVVHSADDDVIGIISERDIIHAFARKGAAAMDMAASSCMTAKVVTCTEEETIPEVMERMTRGRFRHLPVMRDGDLIGVISIGDVVKFRIEQAVREAEEMRSYIATV
ncbi:MAG: inosine-5-monophosphate dehydrogenase [Hyphomicrobiales bacterium]|nr:MAG: inosine-5-monophosphate dehydrogenase [Hyphomicrobiales bacterium]